jgi:uncharacterized protein YjbJ (UPF0337 family)
MNDRFEGTVRTVAGRAQDAAGGMVGDVKTQARGAYNQASGAVQQHTATFREVIRSQPLVAAFVAAGIGYFLGRLS